MPDRCPEDRHQFGDPHAIGDQLFRWCQRCDFEHVYQVPETITLDQLRERSAEIADGFIQLDAKVRHRGEEFESHRTRTTPAQVRKNRISSAARSALAVALGVNDVPTWVRVKTPATHNAIIVRPAQSDSAAYALVRWDEDERVFRVGGWLWGWDVKRRDDLRTPEQDRAPVEAFYAEPPHHPIEQLVPKIVNEPGFELL